MAERDDPESVGRVFVALGGTGENGDIEGRLTRLVNVDGPLMDVLMIEMGLMDRVGRGERGETGTSELTTSTRGGMPVSGSSSSSSVVLPTSPSGSVSERGREGAATFSPCSSLTTSRGSRMVSGTKDLRAAVSK